MRTEYSNFQCQMVQQYLHIIQTQPHIIQPHVIGNNVINLNHNIRTTKSLTDPLRVAGWVALTGGCADSCAQYDL